MKESGKMASVMASGTYNVPKWRRLRRRVERWMPNGQGKVKYSRWNCLRRRVLDGNLRHGQGKLTYSDGGVYEGEWKDGKAWPGSR